MRRCYVLPLACAVALVVAAAGCATGPASCLSLQAGANVEHLLRGRSYVMRVAVENVSAHIIVIRSLEIEGQLPDTTRWYGSRYGSLSGPAGPSLPGEPSLADEYVYDPMAQQLTDGVIAVGLLLPGHIFQADRTVVLFGSELTLNVGYNVVTAQQASEHVYFPVEKDGMRVVFRRIKVTEKDLPGLGKKMVDTMVVIPDTSSLPGVRDTATISLDLEEGPFPLHQARKQVDFDLARSLYWDGGGGWVLQDAEGERTAFVSKDRSVALPNCDLLTFVLLDAGGKKPEIILPLAGYHALHAQAPRREGPGYFNPGTTAVAVENVSAILERARKLGHAVRVLTYDPNGLGALSYVVVGDFDPGIRREFADGKFAYRLWYDFSPVAPQGYYYLWKTGEAKPKQLGSLDALKQALARAPKDCAVLALPSREGDKCKWVKDAALQEACKARGIRLNVAGQDQ